MTVTQPWQAAVVQLYGPPVLDVTVPGIPITQGSMKSIGQGKPLVSDSSKLKPWRNAVTLVAKSSWRGRPTCDGPVEVHILFAVPKPVSARKNWRDIAGEQYPTRHRTGDTDKLTRAVLDALTEAKIYRDDSQVIDIVSRKRFASGPDCHLMTPGAHILLWPVP